MKNKNARKLHFIDKVKQYNVGLDINVKIVTDLKN